MVGSNFIFPSMNDPSIVALYTRKYSEVNTGLAYHSFHKHVEHFGNDVPIPLILKIDGLQLIKHADIHKLLQCLHWEY